MLFVDQKSKLVKCGHFGFLLPIAYIKRNLYLLQIVLSPMLDGGIAKSVCAVCQTKPRSKKVEFFGLVFGAIAPDCAIESSLLHLGLVVRWSYCATRAWSRKLDRICFHINSGLAIDNSGFRPM